MSRKGVSLPIHTIIIITLGILVLLFVVLFFFGYFKPGAISLQQAWQESCRAYLNGGDASSIKLYDVNNDGKKDDFLTVCQLYYGDSSLDLTKCEEKCRNYFFNS